MPLLDPLYQKGSINVIDRVNIGSISPISPKRVIDRVNIGSITLSYYVGAALPPAASGAACLPLLAAPDTGRSENT